MKIKYPLAAAVSLLISTFSAAAAAPGTKPNIVIILSDDHGHTDLGAYGVDRNVQTPAMDKLATNGALMKYGYSSAPQCVPSRAGLMSGRVQNTFGLRGNGDSDEPLPLDVLTLAERIKKVGGYRTGFVGKWHLGNGKNGPDQRGFDDYMDGTFQTYRSNYDLEGKAIPRKTYSITTNRVEYQGKAGAAFIEKNHAQPFFLYLALYGPHLPRIEKTDPYYLNFPKIVDPTRSEELNDIRRQGLALVKAVDDAVDGVMKKLRQYNLEENTIVFFSGDNGAQPKLFDEVNGKGTVAKWDGSENIPLRGEKGSLWEGGMKVPMWIYWKGHIPGGQLIPEAISTLDFTATALKLAGGTIPPEFDGMDVLPYLSKKESQLVRSKPLFWDWGDAIALQKDGWKIHRFGDRLALFNLKDDPNELFDLQYQHPEKFKEMQTALMARYNTLPEQGKSKLHDKGDSLYFKGAPANTQVDPRFLYPYKDAKPAAYPAPLKTPGKP